MTFLGPRGDGSLNGDGLGGLPEFELRRRGPLSDLLRARGIATFRAGAAYVRDLPYRRPGAPTDPAAVLTEGCGTCSSKHALLARIAAEQGVPGIELVLGFYQMRERNTPGVGGVLDAYGLPWLPEAHCYLRHAGQRIDVTGLPAGAESPFDALLGEERVEPDRLAEEKPSRHRALIARWAAERGLDAARVWEAREACIAALQGPRVVGPRPHAPPGTARLRRSRPSGPRAVGGRRPPSTPGRR